MDKFAKYDACVAFALLIEVIKYELATTICQHASMTCDYLIVEFLGYYCVVATAKISRSLNHEQIHDRMGAKVSAREEDTSKHKTGAIHMASNALKYSC